MRETQNKSGREKGSALVEFALCFSLVWLPLFLGMMAIGLNLIRAIQVTEVCRDAAHMFAHGIDFSQSTNRNVLLNVAQGLNITNTGGNGVVVLSMITFIGPNDCNACANQGKQVITRRITIGNASLRSPLSAFGNPTNLDASGNVTDYLTNPAARAIGFDGVMTLVSQQYAYVGEMFISSPELNWYGQLGSTGSSARSIF